MKKLANIIAGSGGLLVVLGLLIFTTETVGGFLISSALMLNGFLILLWICNRWDFGRED